MKNESHKSYLGNREQKAMLPVIGIGIGMLYFMLTKS